MDRAVIVFLGRFALQLFRCGRSCGGHFDPEIVSVFFSIRPEIERIALLGIDD